MPIYEFYCPDCHCVFSFFTASSSDRRQPDCPRCQRSELDRKPSTFAMISPRTGDTDGDDPLDGISDERLAGAMETLVREAEGLGEDDPRAMGRMMRRFGELTGLSLGERMEAMVERMEAGEDPEALEAEMEAEGDDDLDGFFELKKALGRSRRRPKVDDELYFL